MASLREAISRDPATRGRLGLGGRSMAEGTEGIMVRFLRAANWRVEEALAILKTYMSLGEEYQAYCVRAVPTLLDRVWEANINCMLERRDQYGRRVFIYRLGEQGAREDDPQGGGILTRSLSRTSSPPPTSSSSWWPGRLGPRSPESPSSTTSAGFPSSTSGTSASSR